MYGEGRDIYGTQRCKEPHYRQPNCPAGPANSGRQGGPAPPAGEACGAGAKPEFYQEPDRYSPREPEESSGLYWMEPGEDGPKVRFSGLGEKEPEGKPVHVTTANTNEVDREIERLKKKVEDLDQRSRQAQGPERERLERQLKQAQSELDKKDNDTYRRQHAKFF